jgi:dTDP-4-dehydrorhamnose 3,5-epimerase
MKIIPTKFPEVQILRPVTFRDDRGFFQESYNYETFAQHGIDTTFVQDNHSLSRPRGTLRGLHYQIPPFAQSKLLRVIRGSVFDVVVDIRRGSLGFGKHISVILQAEDFEQIFIPPGFAHGFCTLEPDCEVIYKVSKHYSAAHERGIAWNDPDLGIAWPIAAKDLALSEKDKHYPRLRDAVEVFE